MAAKIISECGIFGLMIVIFLTFRAISAIYYYLKIISLDEVLTIRSIGAVSVIIVLFIRNPAGYFLIPTLLALAMLTYRPTYEFDSN